MSNTNSKLNYSRQNSNDEIYTHIDEICDELKHYRSELSGKIVYCNCDDFSSAFCQYFITNFNGIGLKYLICTAMRSDRGFKLTYDGNEIRESELEGNGDFASDECVEILRQSDVVVSNPPFSLIHKYIDLIISL